MAHTELDLRERRAIEDMLKMGAAHLQIQFHGENPQALPSNERAKVADFYAARDSTTPPLPWANSRGESSIKLRVEASGVWLSYRVRERGAEEWKDMNYNVPLVATPCHLGGSRPWFLCPAKGCGRRVAKLYGCRVFACRQCHRLACLSQREPAHDRHARRADKIREKLGWRPGILNGPEYTKPKGMHWRTYERLVHEYRQLEQASLRGICESLGVFVLTCPFFQGHS